jgi:hypothetical protein
MLPLKNKYIALLIIVSTVLTTCLTLFWNTIFIDVKSFIWTEIAIALFLLYESMVILITDKKSKTTTPRQSVNLFLGLKVGKLILSLLFVGIYAIAIKIELKRFILVFVALYFVYLLFDTVYLAKATKNEELKTKN